MTDRPGTATAMIALLAIDLYRVGYRVIRARANSGCSSCYEYALLHVHCPSPRA